jgi:hypothetical protein
MRQLDGTGPFERLTVRPTRLVGGRFELIELRRAAALGRSDPVRATTLERFKGGSPEGKIRRESTESTAYLGAAVP